MAVHLESGATLNQYRILGLIGRGGMGEVYAADDTRLGRKVAIKILPVTLADDAERLQRFTQEARAVSALNHPSILTIYDVDEVGGHTFLVTEFIAGYTLRERMRRGTLEVREAVEIAYQVAGALSAAHAAGIVHRDVKPDNIMLRDDGHAKLLDFGLAKIAQDAASSTDETIEAAGPRTTPGVVMGTTAYMSPEQARGLPVDARSDIFSLGVVLYEMAAGRPPFRGETASDVIAAILRADPPVIADLPPELEHALRKALEKDRDERHQTAKDLAADLKRLRRRLDSVAGRPGPGAGAPARWRGRAVLASIAALVVIGVAGVA
jgi:serine/threonine protein kinase